MQTYPAARNAFLFGEPSGFFDPFRQIESVESPLREPLLAFKANLYAALQVGNVPFQLIQAAVVQRRYTQLMIAEKIRAGDIPEEEANKLARKIASANLDDEMKDRETSKLYADEILR